MSQKRITKWTMGSITMDVDYDEMLRDMATDSELDIIEAISSSYYWSIALPWIDASDSVRTNFFEMFQDPEAVKARNSAIKSNYIAKKERELDLLEKAFSLTNNKNKTGDDYKTSVVLFGCLMSDLITNEGGHKFLTSMGRILKDGRVNKGKSGGLQSNQGKLLKAFIKCHLKDTSRLPTKKKIRDLVGIIPDTDQRRDADHNLRLLGLGGLPPS
jgi:hypothetical protein